jgi:hypothetical protein
MKRILVACEFSGIVRDAFTAVGWDAWSCDLLPSDRPGNHIQDDVLNHLSDGWDMMIAHPPCTFLCNSGVRWLKGNPKRQEARIQAIEFVDNLWTANIDRVCIENPIGCLSTLWHTPSQIIQPFDHGHPDWKSTCLWLRGLPLLQPSVITFPEEIKCGGKKPGRVTSRLHRMSPGPNRWKERSRTYQGIADAMANQWGNL